MLLAFSLQLPGVPSVPTSGGQQVPTAPATPTTTRAPAWSPAWSDVVSDAADALLAVSDAFVFLAGPAMPLHARTTDAGAVAWQHTVSSWQALAVAGPLVLGVAGEHAYALDAADGRTRWVTTTTGADTRLVIDAPHLLLASNTDLLLRDLDTGTPRWRAGLTAVPSAPVAMGGDLIVAATGDGLLTAFERGTGAPRWQTRLTGRARVVTVAPLAVYVGFDDGRLCNYASRSGTERWCFPLRVPLAGQPMADADLVRVALLDNTLRTFDRQTGSMRPPIGLGHRPAAGPWLAGASIIVVLTTGEVAVVDRRSDRVLSRLPVAGSAGSHLLERADIAADGRALATITVSISGERRLSVYRPTAATGLPVLPGQPILPFPSIALPARGVTPAAPSTGPRPFPAPR